MPLKFARFIRSVLTICLVMLVSACSNEQTTVVEHIQLTNELQASYDRSCKNCHELPATTAPQTGDTETWRQILEKGLAATVDRAVNGFKGMPPGGQCFECTPDQMGELIRFMAQARQ